MHAYDLHVLPRPADRDDPDCRGWCYGSPPGIRPAHWPLDPNNGYPLMHGFTLLLPEDHRCHGPELVALAFFGCAPDHNDGMPLENEALGPLLRALAADPAATPAHDPALAGLVAAMRDPHPRLRRMTDILGCAYAAIPLTREEFDGPLAELPPTARHPALAHVPEPGWMRRGSGRAADPERDAVARLLGGTPAAEAGFQRALDWSVRADDPNAGVAPVDFPGEGDAYTSPFDPGSGMPRAWAEALAPNHVGGTMQPVQAVPPDFGAHVVGFEEYLGDFNFGTGNAQLDFERWRFDWAC